MGESTVFRHDRLRRKNVDRFQARRAGNVVPTTAEHRNLLRARRLDPACRSRLSGLEKEGHPWAYASQGCPRCAERVMQKSHKRRHIAPRWSGGSRSPFRPPRAVRGRWTPLGVHIPEVSAMPPAWCEDCTGGPSTSLQEVGRGCARLRPPREGQSHRFENQEPRALGRLHQEHHAVFEIRFGNRRPERLDVVHFGLSDSADDHSLFDARQVGRPLGRN